MNRFFHKQAAPILVTVFGLGLVLCLGAIDYLTGREFSFSVFYLFPVFVAAWFAGRWPGVLVSAASAVTWFGADLLAGGAYSHPVIHLWNTLSRLLFFLLVTLLVSEQKRRLVLEEELARTDGLTGVCNARFFLELCNMEIGRARRYNRPITMIYLDADGFKDINDRFGHNTGDAVLRSLAETMKAAVRSTDTVARLGGDEFAILLPETAYEPAQEVIRKVRQRLLDRMAGTQWSVTFSIGAVTFASPPGSAAEMVREADDLMYAAKRGGKDRLKHKVWGQEESLSEEGGQQGNGIV